MRRRVRGMNSLDETILEFLAALGTPAGESVALTPADIHENLSDIRDEHNKSYNTVSRHMQILDSAGFLDQPNNGRSSYQLTELGFRYVDNELTDEEREKIADRIDGFKNNE